MSAKDVIRNTMDMSEQVINAYLTDLSDADLLIRPVPGMNHIAWQLGHLIQAERSFIEGIKPGSCPPLPENFEEGHGRDKSSLDDATKVLPLARYKELWSAQRAATKAVLDSVPEEDFDKPGPERLRQIAPTVGTVFNLVGNHALMHCGQFVAVRRKLDKPVSI